MVKIDLAVKGQYRNLCQQKGCDGNTEFFYAIPDRDAKPESNNEEHQTNQNEGHSTK